MLRVHPSQLASAVAPLCRFTGADTGRPWGSGGVWLEPYDEASANATVTKLFDTWHCSPKDLESGLAEAGPGGDSDAEAGASGHHVAQ